VLIKNGTLAHVPLGGGGVRELVNQVVSADWLPDGSALVAVRSNGLGHSWLEFPLGTRVHEWSGPVGNLRVSPDGALAAVMEMNTSGGGWLTLIDRKGQAKRMTGEFSGFGNGLIWSRTGDEVWFSASPVGLNFGIRGVTRGGVQRVVHQAFGNEYIQDQTADGRALIVHEWNRTGMVALAPGQQHERELSWLDFSRPFGLSADGTMVSFTESGAGVGPVPSTFIRPTDGSPAIRLGEGQSGGFSPDGTHVLMTGPDRRTLKVVPVGAGEVRRVETGSPKIITNSVWTPDGTRIVFAAREDGRQPRLFVVPAAGGQVRPITPEGVAVGGGAPLVVSSDSRYVLARERGKVSRYPIEGGEPAPLIGLVAGDIPSRWSADGRSIWVLGGARPTIQVFQIDVATGRRTLWREIATVDPAGFVPDFLKLLISADGKSYVYGYLRSLSDLYVADGVR
jgi:eukaryotic-like serine/threonine-protein kinase